MPTNVVSIEARGGSPVHRGDCDQDRRERPRGDSPVHRGDCDRDRRERPRGGGLRTGYGHTQDREGAE